MKYLVLGIDYWLNIELYGENQGESDTKVKKAFRECELPMSVTFEKNTLDVLLLYLNPWADTRCNKIEQCR